MTRRLDEHFQPYHTDTYSDPPLVLTPWTAISEQGFAVSQLSLGTQSGTHIDAPAHFCEGGATIDQLPVADCMGSYCCLDLPSSVKRGELAAILAVYRQQPIVVLRTATPFSLLDSDVCTMLLRLPLRLLVLVGNVQVGDDDVFAFYRQVAAAGIFLVEDLDLTAAATIPREGELIALPLRLTAVSGSPCRVVVRPHLQSPAERLYMVCIREEEIGDHTDIGRITTTAFLANPYSQGTEAAIIARLRASGALTLSLVAEYAGEIIGHIAFSPVVLPTSVNWYGLGPIAVAPDWQRKGIGTALVRHGLRQLRSRQAAGCILVGDPDFYQRFGFQNFPDLKHEGVPSQFVLALSWQEHLPGGYVQFHKAFAETS